MFYTQKLKDVAEKQIVKRSEVKGNLIKLVVEIDNVVLVFDDGRFAILASTNEDEHGFFLCSAKSNCFDSVLALSADLITYDEYKAEDNAKADGEHVAYVSAEKAEFERLKQKYG